MTCDDRIRSLDSKRTHTGYTGYALDVTGCSRNINKERNGNWLHSFWCPQSVAFLPANTRCYSPLFTAILPTTCKFSSQPSLNRLLNRTSPVVLIEHLPKAQPHTVSQSARAGREQLKQGKAIFRRRLCLLLSYTYEFFFLRTLLVMMIWDF